MDAQLVVATAHRSECTFGTGFFRINLRDGNYRYCQNEREVRQVYGLLPPDVVTSVDRDGYCLDGDPTIGDANTPDVVDAEWWLGLPMQDGMRELGLEREADYARAYRQIEAAVGRRNVRESQTGVHASIVIKRRGVRVETV